VSGPDSLIRAQESNKGHNLGASVGGERLEEGRGRAGSAKIEERSTKVVVKDSLGKGGVGGGFFANEQKISPDLAEKPQLRRLKSATLGKRWL